VIVQDYTKLRTAEEQSIFSRLKEINPQLIKRLSRRCAALPPCCLIDLGPRAVGQSPQIGARFRSRCLRLICVCNEFRPSACVETQQSAAWRTLG